MEIKPMNTKVIENIIPTIAYVDVQEITDMIHIKSTHKN